MQPEILPRVIFSPGVLALDLARGLVDAGIEATLFSPGDMTVGGGVGQVTADLTAFKSELDARGDSYLDLLRKHPLIFISLARAVQAELVAKAFAEANAGKLDLVHIYTNEEELALPFARFCQAPVVFTHHDPFNFAARYRHSFPRYKDLSWISMSMAQRRRMPEATNWVGNVYHGISVNKFTPRYDTGAYFAYMGRIVEPKGVHLAIQAVKRFNQTLREPVALKIAGKHYSGEKDSYWGKRIEPLVDGEEIQYVGFLRGDERVEFLRSASAILVPSTFDEPFGMVMIEALACGTPVVGLDSGAIPEVVRDGETGFTVNKLWTQVMNAKTGLPTRQVDDEATAEAIALALRRIGSIRRKDCREDFEKRFTLERMVAGHVGIYRSLAH